MNSNRQKILLYGLLAASLVLGQFAAQLNVLIASALAAWVVFQKRLDLLPLLFLANFPVTAFNLDWSMYGSYEGTVEIYQKAYINFAGLPISSGLVTVVAMAAVCGLNLLNNPNRYYPGLMKFFFALWILGATVSLLIALNGIMNGHRAWSGPLRGYLSLIGLFYGFSLISPSTRSRDMLFRDLLILAAFVGTIASLSMFHHRVVFLFASLIPALAGASFRRPGLLVKLLSVFNLFIWAYFVAFKGNTLTLISLYMTSAGLGAWVYISSAAVRRLIGHAFGGFMIVVIVVYMVVAIYGARHFSFSELAYGGTKTTMVEDILFKVFDDRARLWGFVLEDIRRDNLFIPVSGEDLMVIHPKFGEVYVRHGAHNSFLQALRENGIIAGGIIIILMGFCLVKTAQVYRESQAGFSAALAAGSLPTLTVGAVTGHYVIGQTAGALIFLIIGLALSMRVVTPGGPAQAAGYRRRRGMRR